MDGQFAQYPALAFRRGDGQGATRQISQLRTAINWVADAPLAIAIVLDGENEMSETYDEGRVTERLLIGARVLGLGGGTAWFGDDAGRQRAKEILGIPAEKAAHSVVVLGYPTTPERPPPNATSPDASRSPRSSATAHSATRRDSLKVGLPEMNRQYCPEGTRKGAKRENHSFFSAFLGVLAV